MRYYISGKITGNQNFKADLETTTSNKTIIIKTAMLHYDKFSIKEKDDER